MFYYNPLVMSEKTSKYFINNSFKFQCTIGKFLGISFALGLLSIQGVDAQNCSASEPNGLLNTEDGISRMSYHQSIAKTPSDFMTWGEEGEMEMSGSVSRVSFPMLSLPTGITAFDGNFAAKATKSSSVIFTPLSRRS